MRFWNLKRDLESNQCDVYDKLITIDLDWVLYYKQSRFRNPRPTCNPTAGGKFPEGATYPFLRFLLGKSLTLPPSNTIIIFFLTWLLVLEF
jgi:hypothetical protein